MIYIIIGASCTGKTSLVKNTFLQGDDVEYKHDILDLSVNGNVAVIGNYKTDDTETSAQRKRHIGMDRLSSENIKRLPEQIKKLAGEGYDVVVEGMRLTKIGCIDSVVNLGFESALILVDCNEHTLLTRFSNNGVETSYNAMNMFRKKCIDVFNKHKDKVVSKVVRTDTFTDNDFTIFSLLDSLRNNKD